MHAHEHGHGIATITVTARRRALLFALLANAAFLVVELVGGFVFGSLALLADAVHMTSDVLALVIAFAALQIAQRPPTDRHTYGFGRAEVLAAQVNGVILIAGAVAVLIEALHRLGETPDIDAAGVIVIGVLGLLVNGSSAWVLARAAGADLNTRAALWHLVSDVLGSVAVIVAGIGAAVFDDTNIDAIASILIAVLVVVAAWRLLRDSARVLLEAVPTGIDVAAVRSALDASPNVEAVHHVHVWSLASEVPALSAHVVLRGPISLHDAQEQSTELKAMLAERFGITHATLEVECHACLPEADLTHHYP